MIGASFTLASGSTFASLTQWSADCSDTPNGRPTDLRLSFTANGEDYGAHVVYYAQGEDKRAEGE